LEEVKLFTTTLCKDNSNICRRVIFSSNRKYRYVLWDIWDNKKAKVLLIGINPSVADEYNDDRTVKMCRKRVKLMNNQIFGGFYLVNLFAYVEKTWNSINTSRDPVGKENDKIIVKYAEMSEKIIVFWGNKGSWHYRNCEVLELLKKRDLYCYGKTIKMHPKHISRLPNSQSLVKY